MPNIMTDKRKVSGGDIPKDVSYEIQVTVDYTNVGRNELITRAYAGDVIRIQGGLRKLTGDKLRKLETDGYSVKGESVGVKRTTIDLPATLKAMGWSDDAIKLVTTNPEMAMKLFEEMTSSGNETNE